MNDPRLNDLDFANAVGLYYGPKATYPFIVFADSPGARAPTFKHSSRSAAEAEARRLSALTPGVNFYVMGALSITTTPRPVPVKATTRSLV
jgi:hypothetical protein